MEYLSISKECFPFSDLTLEKNLLFFEYFNIFFMYYMNLLMIILTKIRFDQVDRALLRLRVIGLDLLALMMSLNIPIDSSYLLSLAFLTKYKK